MKILCIIIVCLFFCGVCSLAEDKPVFGPVVQEVAKKEPVMSLVIYTSETCPHCPTAIKFAKDNKLNYTEIIFQYNKSIFRQKGISEVPYIEILEDKKVISAFNFQTEYGSYIKRKLKIKDN